MVTRLVVVYIANFLREGYLVVKAHGREVHSIWAVDIVQELIGRVKHTITLSWRLTRASLERAHAITLMPHLGSIECAELAHMATIN